MNADSTSSSMPSATSPGPTCASSAVNSTQPAVPTSAQAKISRRVAGGMAEVGCAGMRKFWFLATFACLREFRYTRKKSCGGQVEAHTFFLVLLTILLAARILGELAARLKAPPG